MTTKFYDRLYLDHEFLPASAAIPAAQFKSITLCREDGVVKIALTLRREKSDSFEMYDEEEKLLKISCTPEQIKEYLTCLRRQWKRRKGIKIFDRKFQLEYQAEMYVRNAYKKYKQWHEDNNVTYAGVHEHSCSWKSKETTEFSSIMSIKYDVVDRNISIQYIRMKNPRPGIDVEEYIEFTDYDYSNYGIPAIPILHTVVTVWHKGMKKVQSQTGYSENHRTKKLSWLEAAELIKKWTTEAEKQAEAKRQAEEYQREEKEYRERWKDMEGMRLTQSEDSPVISCQYSGPHVADYCGNYLFPIPKNIKSYSELRSKINELLDDYYANCE